MFRKRCGFLNVFGTSYKRSFYVLCPRGDLWTKYKSVKINEKKNEIKYFAVSAIKISESLENIFDKSFAFNKLHVLDMQLKHTPPWLFWMKVELPV